MDTSTALAEQFKQYLKREGLFFTPQRLTIAQFIVNKKDRHFSPEELYNELRAEGNRISRATVYRTLTHLHQAGFLREVALNSSQVCYDFVANVRHHEHLVCEQCGKIIEFSNQHLEKTIEATAAAEGMKMTRHTVQIFGICSRCQKITIPKPFCPQPVAGANIKPLDKCLQGETVIIQRITGTSLLRKRLLEMGFIKGKKMHIIKYAPLRDPMEVKIGDTLVSLRIREAGSIQISRSAKTENPYEDY